MSPTYEVVIWKYKILKIHFEIIMVRRPIGLNPSQGILETLLMIRINYKRKVSLRSSWGVVKIAFTFNIRKTARVAQSMRYHSNHFCANFKKCIFQQYFVKISDNLVGPNLNLALLNLTYEKYPKWEALSEMHYIYLLIAHVSPSMYVYIILSFCSWKRHSRSWWAENRL